MYYDPIKNVFADTIKKFPFLRVLFYKTLDLMFLRSWYVRRELKNLRKVFGDKEISVYDAGTGYSQYSYFIAKNLRPCKIHAIDVKEDWIKDSRIFFASQNLDNVSFGVEDLTEINHTERYDIVLSVDVMEHIEDDVKVFGNFYNSLRNGGFLIINTPSIYGGSDAHDEEDESFIGEHARLGYSFEDLAGKLEPLGFSIYRQQYTYGVWGVRAWRLGIKYPMMMLNRSKLFFAVLPFYYLITLPFTLFMMYVDFVSDNSVGAGVNLIAQKK